jgi:hypothetical protein
VTACPKTRSLRPGRRSGLSGAFEQRGEPEVARAADMTITRTSISLEAGDYVVRAVFRDDRSIAGLHILNEENA